jgi:hypothetical protein
VEFSQGIRVPQRLRLLIALLILLGAIAGANAGANAGAKRMENGMLGNSKLNFHLNIITSISQHHLN